MNAPSVQFRPPVDVHLLRGQSFQILSDPPANPSTGHFFVQLLEVDERYIDQNPTSSYRFRFSFDETKAADLGIHITNPSTNPRKPNCVITLDATEPADKKNRIRNFYLFAESTDTRDHSKRETALRIHIHTSISEVWIAPNPLTIYQGLYYLATLYARFDDNTVAMAGSRIHTGNRGSSSLYNINPLIEVTWSSTTAGLIRPTESLIRPAGFSGTHTISAEFTYNGTTYTATSQVIISDLLTANSPLRAELVSTGFSPGFSKLNEITNVLFLSDGFTADQEYAFKVFVLDYVYDLVSKKISSPFDLLKGAINYWMVFVPSRESGVTSYGELIVNEALTPAGTTYLEGYPVPAIVNPNDNSVLDFGIRNLLYYVGLPILQTDTATYEEIANLWKATTRLTPAQVDQLISSRTDLVDLWQTLSQRRLPEPRDTALGVTINDYTGAFTDQDYNLINLDGTRTERFYLDEFFAGLRDTDGNLIGRTFIQSPSSTDDPTLPQGKDLDNIIIITASKRGRAQNATGYMFANIGNEFTERLHGDFASIRVAMEPTDLPFKLPLDIKATITHELCHSFGLGDEYGESPPLAGYLNKSVTDPLVANWPLAQYTGSGEMVDSYSNVQAKADLLVPVSDGTQQIQPYHIKWRYHRIRTCATVTSLTVTANTLSLTLKAGQATPFTVGNTVFLRKRKKNERFYTLSDSTSGSAIRLSLILDPAPVPPVFIGDCDIDSINLTTDTIRVKTRVGFPQIDAFVDIRLESGKVALLQVNQRVTIREELGIGPIYTVVRNPPNKLQYTLSPLITITHVDATSHQLTLTIPADFPDFMKTLTANDDVLVYRPIDMPDGSRSADYPHAELIAQPVLNYLLANPFPFNADSQHHELIDKSSNSLIPGQLVPCCTSRKKEIIGLYAGGVSYHSGIYHPAAQCMMRHEMNGDKYVELCAVCRYTLINQIDPTKFAEFDKDYMARKIYPD